MKTLDLHGIKHSEVQRVVDVFLWDNIQKKEKEVEIITGISEQMKVIVKDCMKDYNMECNDDLLNFGKIIVKLV
jgi:DNA-nicking Smr family endonuclease